MATDTKAVKQRDITRIRNLSDRAKRSPTPGEDAWRLDEIHKIASRLHGGSGNLKPSARKNKPPKRSRKIAAAAPRKGLR